MTDLIFPGSTNPNRSSQELFQKRTWTMTFSSKLSLTTAALAALGLAAAHPAAAQSVITFGAAQNITSDSDILTNGTLVEIGRASCRERV